MTRAEQKALDYVDSIPDGGTDKHPWNDEDIERAHQEGYQQAEKDTIAIIESRLSELLGDAQPTPTLRHELQDLIKKIKEE